MIATNKPVLVVAMVAILVPALFNASCTQGDRAESRHATGPRVGPTTLSTGDVDFEPELSSSTSRASTPSASPNEFRAKPDRASHDPAVLRPPEAVMTDYLDAISENAPTIGRQNHAAFLSESRDVPWADYVELHLREYLEGQRRGGFTIVGLECRSTMCEVLAVNGTAAGTSVEVDAWQDLIHAMKREPWYESAQILEPEIEFGLSPDGRVATLTHLVRK